MRVDLGWATYRGATVAHRWEYDQAIGLLRSWCHTVYRRTESVDFLEETAAPRCKFCTRKEKQSH